MNGEHTGTLDATRFRDDPSPENTYPCFWQSGNLIFQGNRIPNAFGYAVIEAAPSTTTGHGYHDYSSASSCFVGGQFEITAINLARIHAGVATGSMVLWRDQVRFTVDITVRRPQKNT